MSIYAIGDIQGCFPAFQQLLRLIAFNPPTDQLWLVGDLVNRGPDSLHVLQFVRKLDTSVRVVLGNHDLFLLAVAEGVTPLRSKDTVRDILKADDRDSLIEWLRRQPLLYRNDTFLMVHAGLLPQWTADEAAELAREVETVLAGPEHRSFLYELFHGSTSEWSQSLCGTERLASIARVFTKLRICTPAGKMCNFSGPPEDAPFGYLPWFRIPDRRNADVTIITGHWAALGLYLEPNLFAIDSGCVWGRQLTAIRLEDRAVFQVDGPRVR